MPQEFGPPTRTNAPLGSFEGLGCEQPCCGAGMSINQPSSMFSDGLLAQAPGPGSNLRVIMKCRAVIPNICLVSPVSRDSTITLTFAPDFLNSGTGGAVAGTPAPSS